MFISGKMFQAACIPHIISGVDVVLAAETGSGKTHGYLVPLIDKLGTSSSNSIENRDAQAPGEQQNVSLVVCPNVMLCDQVVRMANSLLNSYGEPFVKVFAVCGRQVNFLAIVRILKQASLNGNHTFPCNWKI